jgi:hypothetical protein
MFSPFGNGHHLGATPGTWEEPGDRFSRTGTWPRRAARGAGKAGRLASRCGEAGQGPSISYMEGPCLILPGRNAIPSTSTGAGTAHRRPPECTAAMIRGHDRGRARSLSGCAATEGRQGQRQQACKPPRRQPGSCRINRGVCRRPVVPGQRAPRPVAGRDEGAPQAVSTCRRLSGKAAAAIGARLRARSSTPDPGVRRAGRVTQAPARWSAARQQDCRAALCAQACGSLV